jgi:hypothetical protein
MGSQKSTSQLKHEKLLEITSYLIKKTNKDISFLNIYIFNLIINKKMYACI